MKLSIIIPVYRVEATLDRCVSSVVGQEGIDMEILLVDDGSPDGCPQRCDEWAAKDPRVKAVHKPNGGLSDARNAGLEQACGDYITFVDSDDYLAADTLRPNMELLAEHPEYDLLEYPIHVYVGGPKERLFSPGRNEYADMSAYWLDGKAYHHTYACNKIFRRALFDTVRFPKGKAFEDAHTLPLLLKHATKIVTTDRGLYCYTWNQQGITATADGEAVQSLLEAYMNVLPDYLNTAGKNVQEFYLQALNVQLEAADKGNPVCLPPYGKRLKTYADYSLNKNIKVILLNLFGIKTLCKLYKILNKAVLHR